MKKKPSLVVVAVSLLAVVALVKVVYDSTTKIHLTHIRLSMIYTGLSAYARDNDDKLPDMSTMSSVEKALFPRYVESRWTFNDPCASEHFFASKHFSTDAALSFRSFTPLKEMPCPPVMVFSSELPTLERVFASGKHTQLEECKSVAPSKLTP